MDTGCKQIAHDAIPGVSAPAWQVLDQKGKGNRENQTRALAQLQGQQSGHCFDPFLNSEPLLYYSSRYT